MFVHRCQQQRRGMQNIRSICISLAAVCVLRSFVQLSRTKIMPVILPAAEVLLLGVQQVNIPSSRNLLIHGNEEGEKVLLVEEEEEIPESNATTITEIQRDSSAKRPTTTTTPTAPPTTETREKQNITTTSIIEIATSSSFSSSNFSIEDEIDFTIPAGDCGMVKCFFRSITDQGIGYLIARKGKTNKETNNNYKNMVLAWNNVKRLSKQESTYYHAANSSKVQFRHFLAGPPIKVEISNNETLTRLNSLSSIRGNNGNYYGRITTSTSTNATTTSSTTKIMVVAQKVYVAPEPSLNLFCHPKQQHRTMEQLTTFVDAVRKTKKGEGNDDENNHSDDDNANIFVSNFRKEWKFTKEKLLIEEPRLWRDFQIMIDKNGRIYHIDLDRYQNVPKRKSKRKPFQKFVKHMKHNCDRIIRKSILSSFSE